MLQLRLSKKAVLSFYLFFFLLSPIVSLSAQDKNTRAEESINITADKLEADKKAGKVTFTGNVVVKQKSGLMMSDLLVAYYSSQNRMEKIIATGNVVINQTGRIGTCQKATFLPDEKKIIMEEEPRLRRDNDVVSGKIITLFLDNDKVLCESCSATIFQEKKNDDGAAKDEANNEQ